jgi:predicted DNA-binding transcriptional regulator AlpA
MTDAWPRLMKLPTAARYLDETPREFRRKAGRVYPAPRKIGGAARWLRDDLDEFVARAVKGKREIEI